MTLRDLWPGVQGHDILKVEYLKTARFKDTNMTTITNIWHGTMFGDIDWPLNASRGLSSIAEFLVFSPKAFCDTQKVLKMGLRPGWDSDPTGELMTLPRPSSRLHGEGIPTPQFPPILDAWGISILAPLWPHFSEIFYIRPCPNPYSNFRDAKLLKWRIVFLDLYNSHDPAELH